MKTALAAFGAFQLVCLVIMTALALTADGYNVCFLKYCIN